MQFLTIKRTVTIPYMSENKKILALAEIGGGLFSKDYTYQLFFEHGYEGVAKTIKEAVVKRGGTVADYEKQLEIFHKEIGEKLGTNGAPTAIAKRTGKPVKIGKKKRV